MINLLERAKLSLKISHFLREHFSMEKKPARESSMRVEITPMRDSGSRIR